MSRVFALFILAVVGASSVAAQDIRDFFPHGVGDRWVYEVEGIHMVRDTLDAIAEWTVLDTRPGVRVDTVWFEIKRRSAIELGEAETDVCVVEVGEDYAFVKKSFSYPTDTSLCRTPGAFPLSPFNGVGYPFLYFRDSLGVQSIQIGASSHEAEMATAGFREDSNPYPPMHDVRSVNVESTLAAGIGQVELYATYTRDGTAAHVVPARDTLRAKLIGADIGGVLYGNIQPVASDEVASSNTLAIRMGPNPAEESITVWITNRRYEQDIELVISDVLGRAVRTTRTRAGRPTQIDVSELPSGLYIVSAAINRQRVQTRLVVAR